MSNTDAPQDTDPRPAVGGPVERQVRPRAWAKRTNDGDYLRSEPAMADTPESEDGLTRYGWQPLFDQACR